MSSNAVSVRVSGDGDHDAILAVHRNAFGDEEGPVISNLVDEMLGDSTGEPLFSLVAELDDEIVGHVLFTAVSLDPVRPISAQILAPLAVKPDLQGKGIGSRLVSDGLARMVESGVDLVFVLGHPHYYSRFGFRPAGRRGLDAPYPILPKNADAWMVQALTTAAVQTPSGTVRCSKALDDPKYWQE